MGLLEVVIAVGLLVTLAAGVVHLFAMSARSIALARHRTSSLMLAVDKLEQLRAGVSTRTAMDPPATRGEQTEHFDIDGRLIGRGRTPPSGSRYTREWSVGALPGSNGVLVVRVTVAPIRPVVGVGGRDSAVAPDGARLVTLLRVQ